MKGYSGWGYRPYARITQQQIRALPYICRLAPQEESVQVQWLDNGHDGPHKIMLRRRNSDAPWRIISPAESISIVDGLAVNEEYEIYVEREDTPGQSALRLFRTGATPGTIVNYLHPEDGLYDFSGHSLCSPCIVKLPSGALLASMDIFAMKAPQNLSLIFRSDDNGQSWQYVTDLFPCFWGKLFFHKDVLYMLADTTEYGCLTIGKSLDEGHTWSAPVTLFPGGGSAEQGPHKAPMPVINANGQLYTAIDCGSWGSGGHASALLSIDENADLMQAENWSLTEPLFYDPTWEGASQGTCRGALEGNAVCGPDGNIYNILRYQIAGCTPSHDRALVLRADRNEPDKALAFDRIVDFPGGSNSKYDLQYDEKSNAYWAVVNEVVNPQTPGQRNVVSLVVSKDLQSFHMVKRLLDYRQEDPKAVAFQYISFIFDGDEILYLSRTALNQAFNFHDANYMTLHRIENFRQYLPDTH